MAYSAAFGNTGGAPAAQALLAHRASQTAPQEQGGPPPAAPPGPQLPGFLRTLAPTAPPPAAGSTDPAYLAYLRSLDYQRSIASEAAQRQLQNLQGQMVIGPEQLAAQGVIARRGISGEAENRGIFRSGERLQNLSDERTAEAQRLAALRLAGAGQYGDIITQLQQNLGGLSNTYADNAIANQARNPILTGA